MADEELLKIVVELRKFRKKLRQIEKLEELEHDLTDEEFFLRQIIAFSWTMFQNDIGEQNINYFKALLLLHVCFFPL